MACSGEADEDEVPGASAEDGWSQEGRGQEGGQERGGCQAGGQAGVGRPLRRLHAGRLPQGPARRGRRRVKGLIARLDRSVRAVVFVFAANTARRFK